MTYPGTRLGLAVLWLLHWLPLPVLRALGALLGRLLFALGKSRRKVALTNLRLCFPELDEPARERLARRHFRVLAQSFLDRPLLWWASERRLRRLIRLEGIEHLDDGSGRPAIVLLPHFVGLDACGITIGMAGKAAFIFAQQSNPVINDVVLRGRARFNDPVIILRNDGLRRAIKALRDRLPFVYPADMDFGARDTMFVPFFGVPAATAIALPRLAEMAGARVVTLFSRLTPDGYVAELLPAWEGYPTGDAAADLRRMNAAIEELVRRVPEQYYWVHKRFKTRPPGEAGFY